VRNLAQRSAEAAQNTSQLIEKSQENANNGVSVADEVATQLNSIKESSEKVNTLIAEITAASREQAQGIDQVNTGVSEMDKVVQQNAADSEESASAAEELSSQAAEMERMVAELKALVEGRSFGRSSGGGKGGGTGNDHERQQALAAPRTNRQSNQGTSGRAGSAQHGQTGKQSSGRPPAAGSENSNSRQHSAEQVIPLDDDEFKDF